MLKSSKMKYFPGVDNACIKQYAVFSAVLYCLYSVMRSIFGGSILRLLNNTCISVGRFWLYYALHSFSGGWILLILSNTHYFGVVDTAYIKHYAVFSGGGYCL